jgi:NTE family protein
LGVKSRFNHIEDNVDFDFIQENSNVGDFDINQIRLDIDDFTNQIFVETKIFKDFRFGMGIEQKNLKASTRTIGEVIDEENQETIIESFNLLSAYSYLDYDSLDHKYFPTQGAFFSGEFYLYLDDFNLSDFEQFSIAKGSLGYVFSPISKVRPMISSELGFRIGKNELSGLNFFLGGYGNRPINNFRPFYGYDFFTLSANSYVKGLIEIDYNFYTKSHLILSANYANLDDDILSTGEWFTVPDFSGYAAGYSLDTIFGPLEVKYTYSPETKDSFWFLSLGYQF